MNSLTLQEAADQLGVHYMTAYRYVRTGRLHATKEGSIWQVTNNALQEFVEGKDPAQTTAALTSFDDAWLRLFHRLVAGDEAGSWYIIEECLTSGMTPHNLYDRLICPAMTEVGERWAAGNLDVSNEHLATATCNRLIGRLGPRFNQPGRSRGTVMLAMVAGDDHALPSAILADILRLNHYAVIDLGANSPCDSLITAAAQAESLVAIGLCSLSGTKPRELPKALSALSAAGHGGRIFAGGPGINRAQIERLAPDVTLTRSSDEAVAFVNHVAIATSPRVSS